MTALDAAIEMARDLFDEIGPVTARKMFGGAALYADGVLFALIVEGAILIKAEAKTERGRALILDLEAEGSERWTYEGKEKPVGMPYWRLPDAALDDPEAATTWARRSLAALGR